MKTKISIIFSVFSIIFFSQCKKSNDSPHEEETPLTPAPSFVKKASFVTTKLNDIEFAGSSIAYIAGNAGTVLKTTDGGDTWQNTSFNSFGANLNYCAVIDAQNAWVVSAGSVYKTTNGGVSWTLVDPQLSISNYNDIHFLNSNVGFLSTSNGLAKTIDGGLTWAFIPSITNSYSKIQFTSSNIGWAFGITDILKTSDGGNTWTSINTLATNQNVAFFRDNEVWVASSMGGNEQLRNTINDGGAWGIMYTYTGRTDQLLSLWFLSSSQGFRSRTLGVIEKTENVGYNWSSISAPLASNENIYDMYFLSSSLGWAVGSNGVILKYSE